MNGCKDQFRVDIKKYILLLIFALFSNGLIPTIGLCDQPNSPQFGVLIPLSGSFSPVGLDFKRGLEIAYTSQAMSADLNQLRFEDTQADPKLGLSVYEKLSSDPNILAIGLLRGPIGMALNPVSKRDALPLLGGVANAKFPAENPYAFQLWSNSKAEGSFLVTKLQKLGLANSICAITAADDFTVAVTDGVREELKKSGYDLVADETVDPTEMDLKSILLRMSQKKCAAFFLNLTLAQYAPTLKRAHELKLTAPIFANFWVEKPEVIAASGNEAVEGVSFLEMKADYPQFNKLYQEAYQNSQPTAASISGYCFGLMIIEALRMQTTPVDRKKFYESLLNLTEVKGLDTTFKIDDRRVQFPLVFHRIHQGKIEEYTKS